VEKFQDPLALLRVQFGEVAVDLSSIFQAMPLYCNLERYRLFFPATDTVQSAFGELFEALLDGLGKPNDQHGDLTIQV
jgi:hypothetical protein